MSEDREMISVSRSDLANVIGQPTMLPNVEPKAGLGRDGVGESILRLRRTLHETQMRELRSDVADAKGSETTE